MDNNSNSDIFRYLMDLVENKPNEDQKEAGPSQQVPLLLKEELNDDDDELYDDDELDDILEENIVTQKIKELNVSRSDDEDDIKELMGIAKEEKVDCTAELEAVSEAIQYNRKLKECLQQVEYKLLAKKREIALEEEKITHLTTTKVEVGKKPDFFSNFLSPYFRDGVFPCPPNRDEIAKRCLRPKLYEEPIVNTKWSTKQIKSLKSTIRDVLINDFVKSNENTPTDKDNRKKVMTKINFLRKSSFKTIFRDIKEESLDWDVIADRISNPHTARDCKVLWDLFLKPSLSKKAWTAEEIRALLFAAKEMNFQNWDEIAKKVNSGRSGYQCFIEYQRNISRKEHKWTAKEFSLFKEVVKATRINGKDINWGKVMWYFDSHCFNKLYCKWYKTMCPTGEEVRRGKFNISEDKCILQAVKRDGIAIRDVPKLLPNRNVAQIRERYMNSLCQPDKKYGAWTSEEDNLLMKLVEEHGVGKWAKIAALMKNRSRTQVRQHYKHIKNALIKNPSFTVGTYRKRKGCSKKRSRVRELVKRVDKEADKGLPIHNYELPRTAHKYGEDAELIKYFVYEKKALESRQSIGTTFEKNQEEILRVCNMLGLQMPPQTEIRSVVSENEFCQEYVYEAIKFLRKNHTALSSCEPLQNSLRLFPPCLINVNSLRNLMLRLEEEKNIYEASLQNINDIRGPEYYSALTNWVKRLYVIFGKAFLLKNVKLHKYTAIAKNKHPTCD